MRNKHSKNFSIRLLSFFLIVFVLSAAAVLREGRLFGYDFKKKQATLNVATQGDTLTVHSDGSYIVNTKPLAKDIMGFGGTVPVRIHVSQDNIVKKIEPLPNAETKDFFNRAKAILKTWEGKTVNEAMALEVDGVSGATFSSNAIIGNVKRGLAYANTYSNGNNSNNNAYTSSGITLSNAAALLAALLGAIVPIFLKNRRWHYIQLAINTIVLGLWTGTFVSYAFLLHLFADGVNANTMGWRLAAPLVMAIVAVIYPVIGRRGHYCAHMCPFGSAQELTGKIAKRKLRISPRLNKMLTTFRNILWGVLMALMLTGTWTAWIDYELFTAFLYTSTPIWITIVAVMFLVVSIWVPRPYCRFVCPTGFLIKI